MVYPEPLNDVASLAERFVADGYVRAHISASMQDLIGETQTAFKAFASRYSDQEVRQSLSFIFPGEDADDPDEGFVLKRKREKKGLDDKDSFHFRPSFQERARGVGFSFAQDDHHFFALQNRLYEECQRHILQLLSALDATRSFTQPLFQVAAECYEMPFAYAAPVNRMVEYLGTESGVRAATHVDRSLVTMHMGDVGGQLFSAQSRNGVTVHDISPREGEVIFFPGVKMFLLTSGSIKPLWHGSTANQGELRKALVHFAHARTLVPVRHALTSYRSYAHDLGFTPEELGLDVAA